jgi:hypothetical protein
LNLTQADIDVLHRLGICINYNGYGESIEDLHFRPDVLYRNLYGYPSPFDFVSDRKDVFQQLCNGYASDMALAEQFEAEYTSDKVAVFILPDAKWARRVSGVWSNELANQYPARAHAVLTHNANGGYLVSVRAPLNNKIGADELCARFPGGGGRRAAAGINHLLSTQLNQFIGSMVEYYQ